MTQTSAMFEVATAEGPMIVHDTGVPGDPPVIVLMPAQGVTPGLLALAQRLADDGYHALVPELYHRSGAGLTFGADDRERMRATMGALSDQQALADVGALLATLDGDADRPDVGVIGFCMGGRFVVRAMAAHPDRIVAGAALHPTALLQDGDDSPHLDLPRISGPLYVGFGRDDTVVPPDQWTAVDQQATAHRLPVRIEVHAGAPHGYMLPGPRFHPDAAEASWAGALDALAALKDFD